MATKEISNLQIIIDRFCAEAQDDIVGLWELVQEIEEQSLPSSEVQEQTLLLVRLLLARGLVAGNPPYSAAGYQPWPDQDADAVIGRIRREWDALGRTPGVPDIVWFGLPSTPSA